MPKVAIFYDWLNQWGGAEKVLLNLLTLYPQADIYTLVYDPSNTKWLPVKKIYTSFINKLPFANRNPILYTPLYALAAEQFDLSSYDIVISTTSTIGHCLLTQPHTLFVCYYHNINRHLYGNPLLSFYFPIDKIFSSRPDYNICNSVTVQQRIQLTYDKTSKVINPGINTNFFKPKLRLNKKYYLVVSRMVPHKRIDLAILACQQLKQNLVIIGTGRHLNQLQKIANPKYIKFIGGVTDLQLLDYYQHALALICPQIEDYGLSPLESMACGTPVIAYNFGGITETVVNWKTGLLFNDQTVDSLKNCLRQFSKTKFFHNKIRQHSLRYSDTQFMLHFKKELETLWKHHQNI